MNVSDAVEIMKLGGTVKNKFREEEVYFEANLFMSKDGEFVINLNDLDDCDYWIMTKPPYGLYTRKGFYYYYHKNNAWSYWDFILDRWMLADGKMCDDLNEFAVFVEHAGNKPPKIEMNVKWY